VFLTNEAPLSNVHAHWKPIWRVLYRFVFAYIFLYAVVSLSLVLTMIQGTITQHYVFYDELALLYIVPWVAAHVLRIHHPLGTVLAGDGSFQWVEQFVFLALAALAAIVWSALDRRRAEYRLLDRWLRLFVRLALAAVLFAYGFDKVFPIQFHSITRYDLVRQFGDMSHLELMWTFMAASKGYTILSGVLEVVAGVLLLVPELASAGALLAVIVMGNVVALNLAYNIPVKLFSTNLLLMAVYLVAPELPRLFDLLVRNRVVSPHPSIALSTTRRVDRGVKITQGVLGWVFFVTFFVMEFLHYRSIKRAALLPVPLQGIWLVDDVAVTDGSLRSLFTPELWEELRVPSGEERWSKVVFDAPGEMVIQFVNGEMDYVNIKWGPNHEDALLTDSGDKAWNAQLKLQRQGTNALILRGVMHGVNVTATLHKMDESRFKVRDEGLHLVQPGQ
jgi:uncharacterized membrane protein YphA (DoxX/SURF4 family)